MRRGLRQCQDYRVRCSISPSKMLVEEPASKWGAQFSQRPFSCFASPTTTGRSAEAKLTRGGERVCVLVIADDYTSKEIQRSILSVNRAFFGFRKIFRSNRMRSRTKLILYKTLLRPVDLYGHETWKMLVEDQPALAVLEGKALLKY